MDDTRGTVHARVPGQTPSPAFQMAQGRRLVRFCADQGIDFAGLMTGRLDRSLVAPICDEHGQVVPEQVDFRD